MSHLPRYTFRDWWSDHAGQSWVWFQRNDFANGMGWYLRPFGVIVGGRLYELVYYLKCRWWKRWNVVTCRTLPPTYCERADLLPHVFAEMVVSLVEDSDFLNHWDDSPEAGSPDKLGTMPHAMATVRRSYGYFTEDRPRMVEEHERRLMEWHDARGTERAEDLWDRMQEVGEEVLDAADDKVMTEVLAVRGFLWT